MLLKFNEHAPFNPTRQEFICVTVKSVRQLSKDASACSSRMMKEMTNVVMIYTINLCYTLLFKKGLMYKVNCLFIKNAMLHSLMNVKEQSPYSM